MKQARVVMLLVSIVLLRSLFSPAQQSVATANATVPPLIQFSNVATDPGGNSLSGEVSITFSLYAAQLGGEPLWMETQTNVQLDAAGHYSVQLGITKPNGVPTTLFTTGEARWLGVRIAEQGEQPRVLLLSVPYALKAGDAATIGGLPPSAFVLAAPQNGAASSYISEAVAEQSAPPPTATNVTTTGGTINYLPLFNGTTTVIDSAVFQSATSPFKIGINTTTPATTLDVKGAGTIRGSLSLPATATATATKGANSQPLNLVASVFNSTSSTAVAQTFQWQAEPAPASNDTPSPSGTLNLLFGIGATKPSETGLHIAGDGQITFAAGQTFPGTGAGSVTSVAAGLGLTGGPITSSGTLKINPAVVPQLGVANTFTGNQTVNGNLSATGVVTGSGFQIGSVLFNYGSAANQNAFLGFSGNTTMTGTSNTATGFAALPNNTTGFQNTATGSDALFFNSIGVQNTATGSQSLQNNCNTTASCTSGQGSSNTANGTYALFYNTTGSNNTGTGYFAGDTSDNSSITGSNNTLLGSYAELSTGTLNNATAIGANAVVSESNALVLGSGANVGIGTSKPGHLLDVAGTVAVDSTGLNNGTGIDLTFGLSAGEGISSSRTAGPNQYGIDIYTDFNRRISILQNGNVGIGTATPASTLTVNGVVNATGGFSGQCLGSGAFDTNTGGSCNMDLAEAYTSAQATEPGDLVALVLTSEATVQKSSKRYEPLLLGVVSTNPGLVFDNGKTHLAGDNSVAASKDRAVIALAGRVPVKVSMENGAIQVGDPLTSSSHSGVAMKATAAGKIIGYALAPATKDGKVLTFVQPGYYAAPQLASLQSKVAQLHRENLRLHQENANLRGQFADVLAQVKQQQAAIRTLAAEAREDREAQRKAKAGAAVTQPVVVAAR
jgi:hypothetical protein